MEDVPGLDILTRLRELLANRGYPGNIEGGSICLGKQKGPNVMLSAACVFSKEFRVRCVQVFSSDGQAVRYTIKLNGPSERELAEYGYSPAEGHHSHEFSNGRKVPNRHNPESGDLGKVADALAREIRDELSRSS